MSNQKHPVLPDGFHHKSPAEKRKFLDGAADKVRESRTIPRPLSDDEKNALRLKLQEEDIELHDLLAEWEELKKSWRDNINEQKDAVAKIVSELKAGQEMVTGTTFEIRDYDSDRVFVFFEDGSEINSRPMLPEERQSTIHSGMRKVD